MKFSVPSEPLLGPATSFNASSINSEGYIRVNSNYTALLQALSPSFNVKSSLENYRRRLEYAAYRKSAIQTIIFLEQRISVKLKQYHHFISTSHLQIDLQSTPISVNLEL